MRWLAALVAPFVLTGCLFQTEFIDRKTKRPKSDAVEATDRLIETELAAWRAGGSLDRAARLAGLSGAAELEAIAASECLAPRDLARFANARALALDEARDYLTERRGVRVCAGR